MKKVILLKTVCCVICLFMTGILLKYASKLYLQKEISLVTVCIAAKDIAPRTQIKKEDLMEIRVPAVYTDPFAYISMGEIIGKYTDIQGKIPAGSLFYRSMLYDKDDLPDHPLSLLRTGQSSYALQTDAAALGSVRAGVRVDVYVTIEKEDHKPLTGCLIESARVISVKDHQGISLEDEDSSRVPYMTEIAVNRSDLEYLSLADSVGKIRLFPSEDPYDTAKEAVLMKESPVTEYLKKLRN